MLIQILLQPLHVDNVLSNLFNITTDWASLRNPVVQATGRSG